MLQLKLGWDISQKCNILRLPFHFKMSHNIPIHMALFDPLLLSRSGQGQGRTRGRLGSCCRYGSLVKPQRFGGEARDLRGVSSYRRNPGGIQ